MPIASINGVQLHFTVLDPVRPARSNADVVLVHGLGASLGFWYWELAPALAVSNRVLMFDLRGHGLSSMPSAGYTPQAMAADLEALLDFLDVPDAHFLGHSLGGKIIVHLACQNPQRVKSIVLADVRFKSVESSAAAPERATPFFSDDRVPRNAGLDEEPVAILEALARFRLRTPRIPKRGPFSGIAGRHSALRCLRLLNNTTARDEISRSSDPPVERLAQLSIPTLLVYGERSSAMPTASALIQLWPHARLDIIARADHFFPILYPDRFLSAVHDFFKSSIGQHLSPDPFEEDVGDEI
jgi:pimeloyl-ACP methyl ester carboxylesterase